MPSIHAPEGDPVPDLFRSRRNGSRLAATLLVAGSVAILLLMRTITDDVHRVMFAAMGVALAVAGVVVATLTGSGRSTTLDARIPEWTAAAPAHVTFREPPPAQRVLERGEATMSNPRLKMYARRGCGYCTQAERLLRAKGIAYEHVDVTGDPATRLWLARETGRTTVPQIFIDGAPIGGYTDLAELDRQGALDRLLGARQV